MDPEPDPELSEKSDPKPGSDPEIIFSAPTHWYLVFILQFLVSEDVIDLLSTIYIFKKGDFFEEMLKHKDIICLCTLEQITRERHCNIYPYE